MSSERGSKNRYLLKQPKSLQDMCHNKISQHLKLEKQLYRLGPRNFLFHEFRFDKLIKETQRCANSRHMLNEKPFEKWFRKEVTATLFLMKYLRRKRDIDLMIYEAKLLTWRIIDFKKIFGMPKEILDRMRLLIRLLMMFK